MVYLAFFCRDSLPLLLKQLDRKMRKTIKLSAVLALALVAGCSFGIAGSDEDSSTATAQAPGTPAPAAEEVIFPVEAIRPTRQDISSYIRTVSNVEAERRVEVVSEGVGQCMRVLVDEGEQVKAGDLLAELDTEELQAQIGQNEVTVRQNKSSLDIAEQSLREGIGSKVERDNARFAYEQAVATLNLAQVRLANQSVRAPIGGIITKRMVQKGMLVSTGMPLFIIVDPDSFMLPINVPEKELSRLKPGQEAKVTVDSLGSEEIPASVRRINPTVDPSGTVRVLLDFPKGVRRKLRDGVYARVSLVTETHENALVIPRDCIVEQNARNYLMLVKEEPGNGSTRQIAKRVEVETGLEDGEIVEVLKGLSEDDLVISMGQHTLRPNALVTLTSTEEEIDSRASVSAEEALAESEAAQEEKRQGE